MALDFGRLSWWVFSKLTLTEYMNRQGNLFSANHLFTTVTDGSSVVMSSVIGSKEAHFMILVKSTGSAEYEFEDGPTFTDNGTEASQGNRNKTSSKVATATAYYTPTIDVAGTIFQNGLIPGGSGKFTQIGGEAGTEAKFIVGPNSNHLIRITNNSGSDSKIYVEFLWYEE